MKNSLIVLVKYCFLLFTLVFLLLLSVQAHTFHTSLTVLDYNADEKNVEITMQLFTHDLAQVLETKNKKRIDLETTKEVDLLIFDYLKENFDLQDSAGNPLILKWVGKELEIDKVYIYLEVPFEGSLLGQKMKNSIFFETFEEQTNLVICKFDQKKTDLLFKVGDKFKEIQTGN